MEYVEFPVSGGKFVCKIDADDASRVIQHRWCCNNVTNGKPYVHRRVQGKIIKLHRFLMGVVNDKSLCVDHINGDSLDNRKENLRVCKQGENMRNYRHAWGKEGIRGVMKTKTGKYRARIRYNSKLYCIGTFDTQRDASVAYAFASSLMHGEFGSLPGHEKFIKSEEEDLTDDRPE
jgi:hypothetical protein